MSVEDVAAWLVRIGFGEYVDAFAKHGVDGNKLAGLSLTEYVEIIQLVGHVVKIRIAFLLLCAEKLTFV